MAVSIRNLYMSRCWKSEQVTFRTHGHTPGRFTLLMPQNRAIRLYDQSVQKVYSTLSLIQKSVSSESYIRIDHMCNQWKAEFISGKFRIQSFLGGHDKILPNP
jgi:hypothetical protein